MTFPTAAVVTANMDNTADNPSLARVDILDAVQKLNQIIAHATAFGAAFLALADAAAARTNLDVGFPTGTKMLFVQTSAPTGWTKDTTHNNKALRIVSGTASSGGTVDFTTAFTSKSVAGTVGNTTLATTQMPTHAHSVSSSHESTAVTPGISDTRMTLVDSAGTIFHGALSSTGSSAAHDHSFTGTAIDLAVKYVDSIIATKD